MEQLDLRFKVRLTKNSSYYPVHLAATRGDYKLIRELLQNPTIEVNKVIDDSGVNAFWIAAQYGHHRVLCELAKAGADIYSTHKDTKCNSLHVAVINNDF